MAIFSLNLRSIGRSTQKAPYTAAAALRYIGRKTASTAMMAEKTHRGLAAKITAGKSAGGLAYGYEVPLLPNGLPSKGDLQIKEGEALIVRRIMADYAAGLSPKKIAAALNAEGIPSPADGHWKANTILGNRQRGTGIINNELYIGRRVWNRLRYIHTPGEKRRVSRLNPPDQWRTDEVPALRIVPDALWSRVKLRQAGLDALRQANDTGDERHLSGAHAAKRPTYLLSGLIRCGCCGGPMNIGGSNPKRYYCANAREKGESICPGIGGIAQNRLESLVLTGLGQHPPSVDWLKRSSYTEMPRRASTASNWLASWRLCWVWAQTKTPQRIRLRRLR